jgi:hypothetical protein
MLSDAARDPEAKAQAANGRPAPSEAGFEELAGVLGPRVREILEHASRLAQLQAERTRLAIRRRVLSFASIGVAAIVALALGLRGAWQLADGLAQALSVWSGRPWLGELASGALLLGLVLGGAALGQALVDRLELARRKRMHEERHGN